MMKSLHDRQKKEKLKKMLSLSAGAVVVLLALVYVASHTLKNGSQNTARPFWHMGSRIGTGVESFFIYLESKTKLKKENDIFFQQLTEAETLVLDRNMLLHENEQLKELLGRIDASGFTLSAVLAKPHASLYDALIIDTGTLEGVAVGNKVFAFGSVLLGEVSDVGTKTATVKLFSAPGNELNARIETLNIDVTITGRGGGNFEMTIPRDVTVISGTQLFLPGITPHIVATVEKNVSDERDPFQKILLTSPVNVNELNWVEVEKTK